MSTGAEIIVKILLEQKVDTVFGYPGVSVLPLYDALSKEPRIRHILTTHEQHAAHAADGYARALGKTGVVIATSGPGATNLVTGIANAYMDSSPLVAITCNVANASLGKDSFQEVDIMGITMPVTKHSMMIKTVEKIAPGLRRAFMIANEGRKGPVLVDITIDATLDSAEYMEPPQKTEKNQIHLDEDLSQIGQAVQLIETSTNPLIFAGGGVKNANAEAELLQFAEKICCPVCVSLNGIGVFPKEHPLFLGMTGLFGTKEANHAFAKADLVIAVGTRFSDRSFPNGWKKKNKKLLHMDIDAAEINKNYSADAALIGDAKEILSLLNERVSKKQREMIPSKKTYAKMPKLAEEVLSLLPSFFGKDAVYTTDVGMHQMWAVSKLMPENSRNFITPGGLGTMGFGLSAAEGASIGLKKRVINLSGDGSFHMNLAELSTISAYQLPVVDIIFDNHALGMVQNWQKLNFGGRVYQTEFNRKTNIPALAEAMGVKGFIIQNKQDITKVLEAVCKNEEPAVIQVVL